MTAQTKTGFTRIGVTMGDPSGIGPEIIVATLAEMPSQARSKSVVIGNIDLLRRADQLISDITDNNIGTTPISSGV